MNGSFSTLMAVFLIWLVFVLGCAHQRNSSNPPQSSTPSQKSQPAAKPVVDIPHLINKSPADCDKMLGKPAVVTKLTNDPEMMPGEYRDYRIENVPPVVTQYGLMVRFYKGQAVHFTLDLPRLVDTPEEALLMAGIDVKGTTAKTKAPLADRWSGTFNGIAFKDVAALKMDSAGNKYSTVQADAAR
jgi:hypothetical protein